MKICFSLKGIQHRSTSQSVDAGSPTLAALDGAAN